MNARILLFSTAAFMLALSGCRRAEWKYPKRLMGNWTIERSERMRIYNDGNVEHFEDIQNAGTFVVTEAYPEAETLRQFTFSSLNFEGNTFNMSSLLYTDEAGSRVFFSRVLCEDIFNCDLVWTVEVNKKNKQVWSAYGNQSTFFYPGDRWNPGDDNSHIKYRVTLVRD